MNSQASRFTALFSAASLLASTASLAVDSTWVGGPTGNWNDPANWSAGVPQTAADTATLDVPVSVAVPASVTLKTLTVNAPATLTVASGATLAFANSGSDVIVANADCLLDGVGDLSFSMNGTTGVDYANIKPAAGTTLTLAARVVANGNAGIELNSAGTLLLTNPDNAFTGSVRTSIANGTLAFTHPAALGGSAVRIDGSPSKFVYTGIVSATLTLPVQITAASATLENAGSGTLTFGGEIAPASSGTKTLTFSAPDAAQTNLVTGALANGSGTLAVNNSGAGTLVLSGTCSHTGASRVFAPAKRILAGDASVATGDTTVDAGASLTFASSAVINSYLALSGTLAVEKGATFINQNIVWNTGAAVAINPAAEDGFTLTLSPTNTLNGPGTVLAIPAAATASAATIPNLVRRPGATLAIEAPELGTARNTLFIGTLDGTAPADGPLPGWLTVNGLPAVYSAAAGVAAASAAGAAHSLAALGPSEIPDDATAAAVIDSAGTGGGFTLAADPAALFSLTQAWPSDPAAVDLAGQTLAASLVAIADTGADLALANGTLTALGVQTPPAGPAPTLPALATQPIAWYDFSDAATVTTDAEGRVTALANKGSAGSALDAALPALPAGTVWLGPLYATDPATGLGVARSDAILPPRGLTSLSNAGIAGTSARTVFLVASRSPVSMNSLYAIYLGPDGGNNQDFAIVERAGQTSFSTKSSDINASPGSPVGLNVLTFTTGLGGVPNAGAGYRNGVQIGAMTFNLATVDAPVTLLHRPNPNSQVSGPGDMAEALVFDYTLSDADRAAVEAYLMQKWQVVAQRDDVLLALQNANPAAALTVGTALAEPYAATLSLAKSGPGDVILGGPLSFSGAALIREGALTLDVPAGLTNILAGPVNGPGALVKTGPGALVTAANGAFTGGTAVNEGVLLPGDNASLGTGPVTVADGAALDVANTRVFNGTAKFTNPVTVAGDGPDGLGTLRNTNPRFEQPDAFQSVALSGDASVYAVKRFDIRNGTLDLGGRTLTLNAAGAAFGLSNSAVTNAAPGGAIAVASGELRLENARLPGAAANTLTLAPGASLLLTNNVVPSPWSLSLGGGAQVTAILGAMNTNANAFTGPATLPSGTVRVTAPANGTLALHGPVGGDGGLLKDGPGWLWLLNAANDYAGGTAVTQGNLYAAAPASLGTGPLTVSDAGSLVARTGSGAWSSSDIAAIATETVFTTPATTSLGFDTPSGDFDYAGDLPYIGLRKLGPYALTLSGSAPELGSVYVYEGGLDLTGTPDHTLRTNHLYVGYGTTPALASLTLADTAFLTDDPGFSRAGPTLYVAPNANTRAVLNIGDGALLRGRLYVGNNASAAGAIYQTGGTVTNISGSANEAAIGWSGYGYYRLDGGRLASKGQLHFGGASGATGIFEQRGGAFVLNPGAAPAAGVVGDYYNGTFTTRRGVAHYLLSGGTFYLGHTFNLGEWNASDPLDGNATLTVENDASADVNAQVRLADRNGSAQANVNLNGGVLTATQFQKGGNATSELSQAAINFNGGTLRVPAGAAADFVRTITNAVTTVSPPVLTVYGRGAVVETSAGAATAVSEPLRAPAGLGVAALTVTAPGSGYIGPPAVLFSGACDTPATAFAEIDPVTGGVSAIRVTSPGTGYTAVPTVTLRGGGPLTAATAAATLGSSASGGLTKLGPGALALGGANTYTGPTVVSNGILRLTAGPAALSRATAITLAGGILDLGGATLTNNHVVTLEAGTLANGAISAQGFVKTGPGAATLAATPKPASPEALFQGYVQTLAPVAWYDPSDAATITLNGSGRVTALANKGTRGAALNVAPTASPNLSNPPLLATGALSYAASGLPMLKIDANNTGLASAANLGITGSVPRTVVAVLTRESDTTAAYTCFGTTSAGQMWEVGDRADSSTVVIGGYSGYDLNMSPRPTAKVAHVLYTQLTTSKTSEAWRTGDGQNYASLTVAGDFNTGDSRFFIGNRVDASKGTARGEIGEILVFDRLLSADERGQVMAMLQQKWTTHEGLAEPGDETAVPFAVEEGTLRLSGPGLVAALNPVVWYDPADAATVTLNGSGRVAALANKGTRGASMNAGVRSGFVGPTLAEGAASWSAAGLPMLVIDSHNPGTGLESAGNTGITGTAPRTLVAVLARAEGADIMAVVATGSGSTRGYFEVADRSTGACFGLNSDDITVAAADRPAPGTALVWMFEATAPAFVTGYRSTYPYVWTKALGGDLVTPDSKICLGYRPNGHRADMRGQIGEVLLFDRVLDPAERADLEAYLAAKWTRTSGIDGHLYDNAVFDVAEGAALDLAGARANVTVTGSGSVTNGVLGAGFVVSPAGDAAVGELDLRGNTFASGATYRVTVSGDLSDRILADGDLSGLTVVPATDAEITGKTYVIATGAITQKPALSGFPDKFKLIQQGDDLLLTSVGGTVLLLK